MRYCKVLQKSIADQDCLWKQPNKVPTDQRDCLDCDLRRDLLDSGYQPELATIPVKKKASSSLSDQTPKKPRGAGRTFTTKKSGQLKPRESWEDLIPIPSHLFLKEDYRIISGHELTDRQSERISEIQGEYFANLHLCYPPRKGEIGAALEKLLKLAEACKKPTGREKEESVVKYANFLKRLDYETLDLLYGVSRGIPPRPIDIYGLVEHAQGLIDVIETLAGVSPGKNSKREELLPLFEALSETMDQIGTLAERALPKARQSSSFDLAMRIYIQHLGKVFREISGRKKASITWSTNTDKYEGAFFDFVSECIKKVPNVPVLSNSALGKMILRTQSNSIKISSSRGNLPS